MAEKPPVNRAGIVNTYTIAAAAGVSPATVSRALRGVRGVSAAERDRIRALARQMGYRPNPFVAAYTAQVRAYRRAPDRAAIALLDCWPDQRPPWADFDSSIDYVGGIRRRAEELGYRIERVRLAHLDYSCERLQRMLLARRVYGLLVLPVPPGTDLAGLDYSCFACATIDFSLQRPARMRRASTNYYHNMTLALTTLAARGYSRIGYVLTDVGSARQEELSLAAYLLFRRRNPSICLPPFTASAATPFRDLTEWVRRTAPDAVITNDFSLPADLGPCRDGVPERLGCVTLARPADTCAGTAHVDENCPQVGAQAVDMIVDAIHRNDFGLPESRVVHFVDGIWREGVTVRPPAAAEDRREAAAPRRRVTGGRRPCRRDA